MKITISCSLVTVHRGRTEGNRNIHSSYFQSEDKEPPYWYSTKASYYIWYPWIINREPSVCKQHVTVGASGGGATFNYFIYIKGIVVFLMNKCFYFVLFRIVRISVNFSSRADASSPSFTLARVSFLACASVFVLRSSKINFVFSVRLLLPT